MGYIYHYGLFVVAVLYDLLINWAQDTTQNKNYLLWIEKKKHTETFGSESPLDFQKDAAVEKKLCINIFEKLTYGHNGIDDEIHSLK